MHDTADTADIGDDIEVDAGSETLYLKYEFDGVSTLGGLAAVLHDVADEMDDREAAGWTLAVPVESGWVHLDPPR
jgi:hypothetical protein